MPELKCTKCGEEKQASKKRIENLTTKFGTVEKLNDGYLCRNCRKIPA